MDASIAIAVPYANAAESGRFLALSPVSAAFAPRRPRNQLRGYECAEPEFGSTYAIAYAADPPDRR
jgi:hypothetical protein